jgi:hypothetical protein
MPIDAPVLAEHAGMDLFEALGALFPQELGTKSAAKRAARRGRAFVRRVGSSDWPSAPSTGKHHKDEVEKMALRTGDSVRLFSTEEAAATALANKKAAFLARVSKSLHTSPDGGTSGAKTEHDKRQEREMQARATTGVNLQVVFEDADLAVVFKPGECALL